jgi:hypothetical protein
MGDVPLLQIDGLIGQGESKIRSFDAVLPFLVEKAPDVPDLVESLC